MQAQSHSEAGSKERSQANPLPGELEAIPWDRVLLLLTEVVKSFIRLVFFEVKEATNAMALIPILFIVKCTLLVIIWFSFTIFLSTLSYEVSHSPSVGVFTFLLSQLIAVLVVEYRARSLSKRIRLPRTQACINALKRELQL
jgi:hypothetical protein